MSDHFEDRLYMVGDHFSRSEKMVWDNHFVGTYEMVSGQASTRWVTK